MVRYIDADKISSYIRENFSIDKTKNADICFAFIDFMNWLDEQLTADVVELSEVKKVIMDYILDQTVSKFPTAELCRASRMGAEGVIYALENAFGAKMDGVRKEDV